MRSECFSWVREGGRRIFRFFIYDDFVKIRAFLRKYFAAKREIGLRQKKSGNKLCLNNALPFDKKGVPSHESGGLRGYGLISISGTLCREPAPSVI
jgi:hypothetical protein